MYFLLFILLIVSVRYLLRKFYHIDEIFKAIEITNNKLPPMYVPIQNFDHMKNYELYDIYFHEKEKYFYYKEKYESLNTLTNSLLIIPAPLQKYLMTTVEKDNYSKLFTILKKAEQSLIEAKKSYEASESIFKHFNSKKSSPT